MITDQFSGQISDLDKSWTNSRQIPNVGNDHVLEHFLDNKQCPEFVYYYSEHFPDIFRTFSGYEKNSGQFPDNFDDIFWIFLFKTIK